MFNNLRLVYITTKSKAEAHTIGRALVEKELTACVNIIDGMECIYRWEGEIKEGQECILIAKTPYHMVNELTEQVKQMHSYDCPCVISLQLSEQEGNDAYQKWLLQDTMNKQINYDIE